MDPDRNPLWDRDPIGSPDDASSPGLDPLSSLLQVAPQVPFLQGDALSVLQTLPDGIAQTVITSPPYWGLRDYGIPGQLGLEPSPQEYVSNLVRIFQEVKRVLRPDGTLWLNLGDSYAGSGTIGRNDAVRLASGLASGHGGGITCPNQGTLQRRSKGPSKQLLGMPWRVAFALQEDGWILRSDIIWAKPNCMPESVRDRPTKSHEYLFLFSKQERYFYDAQAIKEGEQVYTRKGTKGGHHLTQMPGYKGIAGGTLKRDPTEAYGFARDITTVGRNKRTVWTIATRPYKGAHFATMPPALVLPCVLAGSSPRCCEVCGSPWERVTERTGANNNSNEVIADYDVPGLAKRSSSDRVRRLDGKNYTHVTRGTNSWRPTCHCDNTGSARCLVLDPFSGAGTVALVAQEQGRRSLGIELNPDYIRLAEERLKTISPQPRLFEEVA